jgi:hypothetical protein
MRLRRLAMAGGLAVFAAVLSGCVYEPAPAPYYPPPPAPYPAPYYGYAPTYYAPGYYYGPSVGLGFRFGGGGHRRHWR